MPRINSWFNALKEKNPYWSDLIIFNTCITDKKVGIIELGRAFRQLVDKEDYEGVNKEAVLAHAKSLISKKD